MQSINFEPVGIEFQQIIRDFFGWDLKDDEEVLEWLKIRISQNINEWDDEFRKVYYEEMALKIISNDDFLVLGANVTEKEITTIPKDANLIVADGAIGALISTNKELINNIICLVSDADGIPYIADEIIANMTILLHAHGHAKDNLKNILKIWESWEYKPKLIISHQTPNASKNAHNFGGFTDGDRSVCLLHSFGKLEKNIQLMGFNTQKIGFWSGESKKDLKIEKLKWMEQILNSLGYEI